MEADGEQWLQVSVPGAHGFHKECAVNPAERTQLSQRVTLVGAVVNAFLALLKVIVGWLAQSHALVADGIHSLSDLLSDVMVYLAASHGGRAADDSHPYCHARIETAVTVALGVFLIVVAAGIAYDASRRLLTPEMLLHPGAWALAAAFVSVIANEGLYQYTMAAARRANSNLLRANAWHHRTDSFSSIVVLVGLCGVMFGLDYLDAIASIVVAVMIAKIGWDMVWTSLQELIDTALDQDRVDAIRASILTVHGVQSVHMLRTRQMAGDALVDVHVQVDPRLSVSEGHQVSELVRKRLLKDVDEVTDVTVHIDPEDDEDGALTLALPLRDKILPQLQTEWAPLLDIDRIQEVTLHYLKGRLAVDLVLPRALMPPAQEIDAFHAELSSRAQSVTGVDKVRVLYQ